MWFRMQRQAIEKGASGSDETETSIDNEETTVVKSMPVEPGDFQRVRLLLQYEISAQTDERDLNRTTAIFWACCRCGTGWQPAGLATCLVDHCLHSQCTSCTMYEDYDPDIKTEPKV